MAAVSLVINGKRRTVTADPDMPLLWVLRDVLGLTGTKFGCGIAQCGACTVHLDGEAVRSCSMPRSAAGRQQGHHHRGPGAEHSHPLQQAWIELDVPQCGYCQSGQIMSRRRAARDAPAARDAEIDAAMDGNICRCGTYQRIRAAIKDAAGRGRPDMSAEGRVASS